MYGRSILIIWLIFTLYAASAQSDFRALDSAMYHNTLSGNWEEVISRGNEALDEGIDYFYLRMRMGIASYNLDNYRAAVRHFGKAREFNPDNGTVNNYLYYAYRFSGRRPEAAFFSGSLSSKERADAGLRKEKFLSGLHFETGPEFSNNFNENELKHLPPGQVYREQDLYGSSYYTHTGLELQVHPRIRIYAGYTNLRIEKRASLQYAWNQPDSTVMQEWGFSRYFPSQPKVSGNSYDYSIRQNSIYLNAIILPGRGWSFTPAIHYVNVNTQSITVVNNSRAATDTAYYISSIDSAAMFGYQLVNFNLEHEPCQLNNVVLSLAINKQVSVFDLGAFASWSDLNGKYQYQYGIAATYYPLGNLNFYGTTTIKAIKEDDNRLILGQLLGTKVFSFLWFEAYGWLGNLKGTNQSNAFIVYNITDNINLKTGLCLTFVLSPAIQLSARYQYLENESFRVVYDDQGRMRMQELEYINQSITGGIKWTL